MEFRLPVGASGTLNSTEVSREQVRDRTRMRLRFYDALGCHFQGTPHFT